MIGLDFVREKHLSVAEGCYLPRADLLGYIEHYLNTLLFHHPELKHFLPNLIDVDLFVAWDEDIFFLFISTEKRLHLPTRGMETKYLPEQREKGIDYVSSVNGFTDITHSTLAQQVFERLCFTPGFAATGTYPTEYSKDLITVKEKSGEEIAQLLIKWAQARRHEMENSRIFLSHKGINKPLIEKIDAALRMLNLKTWFDKDDLAAGDPLVRGVDDAFSTCSAAVFFISGDYVDSGIIKREIDRAIHEEATRNDQFRIIPLVLAQHGGRDAAVPAPLQTLVWKTINDVDIVPSILKALPEHMKRQIRFAPPK